MKKKHTARSVVRKLRILTALVSVCALIFLALLAAANPDQAVRTAGITRRTFMRVTPQGVIQSTHIDSSKAPSVAAKPAERRALDPLGNTLWHYDDQAAIADGVSIDANNVWGAWTLSGARLTI